jgi:hypothetical protein
MRARKVKRSFQVVVTMDTALLVMGFFSLGFGWVSRCCLFGWVVSFSLGSLLSMFW